jgi:hypothetical protein
MFYHCKKCNAVYSKYGYDAPSISYELETIYDEDKGFTEEEYATGDKGESRTYCLNNVMHQEGDLYAPTGLSREESIELLDMFKDKDTVEISKCSASQLARLNFLLKIKES